MAAAPFNVFSTMDTKFVDTLQTFIAQGANGVSQAMTGPLSAMLTIYVVSYGILIMRGMVSEPVMEFAVRCIKLGIILMLVRDAGSYNAYVTQVFFTDLPAALGNALSGGSAGKSTASIASSFDNLLGQGWTMAVDIWKKAGFDTSMIINGFVSVMIMVVVSVVAAIGYVVSLYARVALAIALALGPVFIGCAMFDSTRRFTEAWLGKLVNYVILQVLTVAIGSVILTVISSVIGSALSDALQTAMAVAAIGFAAVYIFVQLPEMASRLAGGGASLNIRTPLQHGGQLAGKVISRAMKGRAA